MLKFSIANNCRPSAFAERMEGPSEQFNDLRLIEIWIPCGVGKVDFRTSAEEREWIRAFEEGDPTVLISLGLVGDD